MNIDELHAFAHSIAPLTRRERLDVISARQASPIAFNRDEVGWLETCYPEIFAAHVPYVDISYEVCGDSPPIRLSTPIRCF